MTAVQISFTS